MKQKLHFISGLPRSGSTLLSAILRQNPRFRAGISGPLGTVFAAAFHAMGGDNQMAPFLRQEQKRDILKGIVSGYYAHAGDEDVVFDTNRGWCGFLPALRRLYPDSKVICCVRDPAWILDSVESLVRRNALDASRLFRDAEERATVYSRAEALLRRDRLIGYACAALADGYYGNEADMMLLVDYDTLCANPAEAIELIYEFIGEPPFAHDFDNVAFSAPAFDAQIVAEGLHTVRPTVERTERRSILPPELFQHARSLMFWAQGAGTKAHQIIARPDNDAARNAPAGADEFIIPDPARIIRWQDKQVPLCDLDPDSAAALPVVAARGHVDVSVLQHAIADAGPALWDPEVARVRNVNLVRWAHDAWGVQKALFIFCDDEIEDVFELPYWAEWAPMLTPILKQLGIAAERVVRCLFAAMPPGCTIPRHHDTGEWVTFTHRVHVPIVTNPDVIFAAGAMDDTVRRVRLGEGDVVELNNRAKHFVRNPSAQTRIHLIFDYVDADFPLAFRHRVLAAGERVVQTRRTIRVVADFEADAAIPHFAVIGAQKAGTTFLFNALCDHPLVAGALAKETHFFDWAWPDALQTATVAEQRATYMGQFPYNRLRRSPSLITGEATPSYLLYCGEVLKRFRAVAPSTVRLLASLRDPVERAWSQYQMLADPAGTDRQLQNRGRANLTGRPFEDIIDEEMAALEACGVTASGVADLDRFQAEYLDTLPTGHGGHGFVARGLYFAQLRLWLREYPREQLLLLCLEEMQANPQASYDMALAHIGLPPHRPDFARLARNARAYPSISDATRQRLAAFYQAHNENLFALIGRRLPWRA